MTARQLWHRHGLALVLAVMSPALMVAQGTPLTVGPLTVVVPNQWIAQTATAPIRIGAPGSNAQQYFTAQFLPPQQTPQDVREHHALIWGRMAKLIRPVAPPQSGVLGRFIWTRVDVQRGFGQRQTLILYSAKAGSAYVGIGVDATRADLLAANLPTFEAMLSGATWSDGSVAAGPSGSSPSGGAAASPQTAPGSPGTLGEYVYTPPPGWTTTQYPDGIVLTSPTSATGERCLISLWPMRPASDDLPTAAEYIFRDVFKTYELRTQTSRGEAMPASIARGTSGQGWDYVIVKKGIGKPPGPAGSYATLLGFVLVAKLDNQLAIVSGLSKDPLVSTCFGELVADVWPRFFYSLRFRSWTTPAQATSAKLIGTWTIATATASDQFVFDANGRYGGAAAAQNYNRVSSSEVVATTQAFFGKGTYAVQEDTMTLTPDAGNGNPETALFRVEEESTDGGRTWIPHLYLLRTSAVDGKEYEVRYKH